MNALTGQPISRVDGPEKVTGQAIYAAEFRLSNLAYAALATSTQGHGWITGIDTSRAGQMPGVLAVITHENAMRLPYRPRAQHPVVDPQSGERLHVLQGPEVVFVGQPIAIVVAETQEQARSAAGLITATYAPGPAHMTMDANRAEPPDADVVKSGRPGDTQRGDAEAAFAAAPVRLDAHYSHEREHHNAMELHATIAAWDQATGWTRTTSRNGWTMCGPRSRMCLAWRRRRSMWSRRSSAARSARRCAPGRM